MLNTTRIKICGIRDVATGLAAARMGADAIGMVLAPGRRQVSPETAREICQAMPPFVTKVGVFVNSPAEEVRQIAQFCGLDLVQLHGSESAEYCTTLGLDCIKAFAVQDAGTILKANFYPVKAVLFDTFVTGLPGGTGKTFNWHLLDKVKINLPLILAGGLTPENVGRAVALLKPYGVDVSSGVETRGNKDLDLIKAFINRVREVGNYAAR